MQTGQVINRLFTGTVIGILSVIVTISFAALIFSGDLSEFRSFGIGFILMGDLVLCILVALLSSYSGSIAIDQDITAAILTTVIAALLLSMPVQASPQEKFFTVVATIVLTSLITGLFFIALGYFKLGGLVRYLPYPVMGGFLAGTGWLLATGAISVMTETTLDPAFLAAHNLIRWLPGFAFGLVLLWVLNRFSHYLILPGMFLAATALFYLVVLLTRSPLDQISAQGWLLGPFPSGSLWRVPLLPSDTNLVNWDAILANTGAAAPILIIAVIALLLNASGIELVVNRDIDLNKELLVAGIGNLAGAFVGGIVGFQAISLSALNHKLSQGSRLTGVATAAFCGLIALTGAQILSFIPKMVLGGILMYLGLSFLVEWIFQAWYRLPKVEFLVTVMIVAVIAWRGFLEGVALGILVTVVLFVVNYSRIDVVKHMLDGTNYSSRVTRGQRQRKHLDEHGDQILILQLQGFIFFGTANSLFERVRQRVREPGPNPLQYIVLDFRQVTGVDSTALRSFTKLARLAGDKNIHLVLTGFSPQIHEQFSKEDILEGSESVHVFPDLDRGLEWSENQLLQAAGVAGDDMTLRKQLQEILPTAGHVDELMKYLVEKDIEGGYYLIKQGDPPDHVYLIESGQVTAQLELPDQAAIRLETMHGGRVVGELGFYLGSQRTASVVVDEPSKIFILSEDDLRKMEEIDPEAASTFHRLIIHLLAERVVHLIKTVNALQR
ncbi:MAG TPA: SulP family inorganic anion transporter [Anaerolineales bacterium]